MAAKRREPPPAAAPGAGAPPASAEEALASALAHGRAATAEALAAIQALLDAAALATSGEPSSRHRLLGPVARTLEELSANLDAQRADGSGPLLASLAAALDAEIARWEQRAVDDGDARAVLRAFLGLRELLWEVGVRPTRPADATPWRHEPRRAGRPRGRAPRVQRVPVEG
jgi:hypothetical protein